MIWSEILDQNLFLKLLACLYYKIILSDQNTVCSFDILRIHQRLFNVEISFASNSFIIKDKFIKVYIIRKLVKGRGPGINSSQSKNVGKIQLSMQLSHSSIIFENIWF